MTTATAVMILPYRAAYYATVARLLMRAGWAREAVPFAGAIDRSTAFMAVAPEGVVGFARIITDHSNVSYLCELAVESAYRGKGVARQLLDACRNVAPTARLDLLSTELAQGFYEHVGYVPKLGYRRWP